jgi:hypothetical protein
MLLVLVLVSWREDGFHSFGSARKSPTGPIPTRSAIAVTAHSDLMHAFGLAGLRPAAVVSRAIQRVPQFPPVDTRSLDACANGVCCVLVGRFSYLA